MRAETEQLRSTAAPALLCCHRKDFIWAVRGRSSGSLWNSKNNPHSATRSLWAYMKIRWRVLRWMSNQRPAERRVFELQDRGPKPKNVRTAKPPCRQTRSLLKTVHCFKSFPDAAYFTLLHFLAEVCHSFRQSWGFLLVPVSQAPTQIHLLWASELLGSLGAFAFCSVTRHLSSTTRSYCSEPD